MPHQTEVESLALLTEAQEKRLRPERLLRPLIFILVIAAWKGVTAVFEVPLIILPPPERVLYALYNGFAAVSPLSEQGFVIPMLITFAEAMAGFLIGGAAGLVFGALIAQWRLLEQTFYPYIVALQTLPKVAIAPLLVTWFGFGMSSKIVITALITFFPVLVNVIAGFHSVDEERLDLMRSLLATRMQTMRKLILPHALPYIFAGFDIAIVFSIIGAIVGEFMGARKGLGVLIQTMNFQLDIAGVFAALVLLSAMGLSLHFAMRAIRRRCIFWIKAEEKIYSI